VEEWNETISSPEAMKELWAEVHATLDDLDAELGRHRFVAGSTYSQADVLWTPLLARLRMLGLDGGFGERGRVAAYYSRMKARPSFREAEVAERISMGKVLVPLSGFLLPRLAVAIAVVIAMVWGLSKVL